MANKYIVKDYTVNGDGSSWAEASTPGGAGAWNNSPTAGASW